MNYTFKSRMAAELFVAYLTFLEYVKSVDKVEYKVEYWRSLVIFDFKPGWTVPVEKRQVELLGDTMVNTAYQLIYGANEVAETPMLVPSYYVTYSRWPQQQQ